MKLTVHPLFLAVGVLSAVFGGLPVFLICALTALLHECGHIFCAGRMGYGCEKIKLLPFGAAAVCDIEGISPADEIKLALSGPAVNAVICVICAGLWWFYPQTYAYTDLVFYASAAMLAINLLPAYPLDGGRVARCALGKLMPEKAVDITLKAVNLSAVAGIILVYVFCLRNPSLIVAALFLLCSVFERRRVAVKINFAAKKKRKGREIKYVILDENATFRDALRLVDGNRYLIIQFYGEKFVDEITEDELYERMLSHGIYDRVLEDRHLTTL